MHDRYHAVAPGLGIEVRPEAGVQIRAALERVAQTAGRAKGYSHFTFVPEVHAGKSRSTLFGNTGRLTGAGWARPVAGRATHAGSNPEVTGIKSHAGRTVIARLGLAGKCALVTGRERWVARRPPASQRARAGKTVARLRRHTGEILAGIA